MNRSQEVPATSPAVSLAPVSECFEWVCFQWGGQPSVCLGLKAFPGQRAFSAKTRTVTGKPGQLVPLDSSLT